MKHVAVCLAIALIGITVSGFTKENKTPPNGSGNAEAVNQGLSNYPLLLGFLYQGSYIFDLEGDPDTGEITAVRLYDSSWNPIDIVFFQGSFTFRTSPPASYDVSGYVVLDDGQYTQIPFSGIAQ